MSEGTEGARKIGRPKRVSGKAQKEHLKKPFLENFRKYGFILQACEATGNLSRSTVWEWRRKDPAFEAAFHEADQRMTELLERSALQRALVGENRNIYHNGRVVGTQVEKSDVLTIFLLKARDRRKYGDRVVHDVQVRFASSLVAEVMRALRILPTMCPHCKTSLDLKNKIGQHLLEISKTFEETTAPA